MKIRLMSDLHLEMLDPYGINKLAENLLSAPPVDILIMAGDVAPARSLRWVEFLSTIHSSYNKILWVLGNHEYYHAQFHNVPGWIRDNSKQFPNVQLLNNQRVVIDGINFIGSTLWTDFDNRNPLVMNDCQMCMNDCNYISYGNRLMTSVDQLALHDKSRKWLFKSCRDGTKAGLTNFVITHHAPSWLSVHEKYKNSDWSFINGGFVSNLDNEIINHKIHTWVHGHTHTSFDYKIGDTRVIANPHGYRDENQYGFTTNNIIEVSNEKDRI